MNMLLNKHFLNALLADASYADLKILEGTDEDPFKDLAAALVESDRFKEGTGDSNRNPYTATIIAANFDYVTQLSNTASGFSGTLFKRKAMPAVCKRSIHPMVARTVKLINDIRSIQRSTSCQIDTLEKAASNGNR